MDLACHIMIVSIYIILVQPGEIYRGFCGQIQHLPHSKAAVCSKCN